MISSALGSVLDDVADDSGQGSGSRIDTAFATTR